MSYEKKEKEPVRVKITQQFRERNNMAYDLDCEGRPLTVRIFQIAEVPPGVNDDEWRIEARSNDTAEAPVVMASGATRAAALQEVATAWASRSALLGLPTLDWDAITKAMSAVRAV